MAEPDRRSPFAPLPHAPEPETMRAIQDLPNQIPGKTLQLLRDGPATIGEFSSQAGDVMSDPRHVMPSRDTGGSTSGFIPAWMNVLGEVVRGAGKHAFGMPAGDMPIGKELPPPRSPFGDAPAHFDTKAPVESAEPNQADFQATLKRIGQGGTNHLGNYLGMRQQAYDRLNAGRPDDRVQLPYTESGPDTWLNMPPHPGGWENAPPHVGDPGSQDPWIRYRQQQEQQRQLDNNRVLDDTDGG